MNTLQAIKNDIENGINVRTKLTVDICNSLFLKGYTVSQIGRATGNAPSTVSQFCKRNKDKIVYDYRNRNNLLIVKSDRIINQGLDTINNILDNTKDFNKRDLSSLTITTGILFDKLRILQGQSTSNISVSVAKVNIQHAQDTIAEAKVKLDALLSDSD